MKSFQKIGLANSTEVLIYRDHQIRGNVMPIIDIIPRLMTQRREMETSRSNTNYRRA
jgi:hypothetical protein